MATGWVEGPSTSGHRLRIQVTARTYEEASRQARLVGERLWPELHFIDGATYHEGELLGFFLGSPYDWDTLDPHLMKEKRE